MALIILTLINSYVKGQCIADAGPDKIVCVTLSGVESKEIGGNPSVINGTGPFTYTWTAFYQYTIGNRIYTRTASNFLNDTTVANPKVIGFADDPIEFILTVKDFQNNICKDTVIVRFSSFGTHLGYWSLYIEQGDSVELNYGSSNVYGGIEPIKVLWRPNHGLTDSTSHSVWAKPQHHTAYYITVTDSAGCKVEGPILCYVYVFPLSISNFSDHDPVTIFPNPSGNFIKIKSTNQLNQLIFTLTNSNGYVVIRKEIYSTEEINIEQLMPGIYFYKIVQGEEILGRGKLIKK